MTNIYSIYLATNIINNKRYVGFTDNLNRRKIEHYHVMTKGGNCNIFRKALSKYGWDSFTWDIVYQSPFRYFTLKVMEPFYIQYYNSYYLTGHGYNMTFGGDGASGYKHNEERRKKIADISRNAIYWKITDPNGNTNIRRGIDRFCREHNLSTRNMHKVANGEQSNHKGWLCERLGLPEDKNRLKLH